MMRLPARLTAKLAKVRIGEIFKSAPENSLLHCVDPAEVLHPGSDAPISREKMQKLTGSSAPVIWIGGSEPLLHAGISHFVRAIARSGHFVFLETDGALLRRRIHEFQPVPQLFLTVRLNSVQASQSTLAVEGLRAARLSGFFTVIHSVAREDLDLSELPALRAFFLEKDLEGWLVTSGSASEAVARKTAEVRSLIPSSFWRQFSEHVEEALLLQAHGGELRDNPRGVKEPSTTAEAHEEGVGIA